MLDAKPPPHPVARAMQAEHAVVLSKHSRRILVLLLTALALTACGTGVDPAGSNPMSSSAGKESTAPPDRAGHPPPAPSASELPERDGSYTAELTIALLPTPGADPIRSILACQGTEPSSDSDVPNPAEACELIQKSAEALFFITPDPTLQCTQQFGGRQTAVIKGVVDGRAVERSYSLTDGCEINRWRTLEPLLGPGGLR